MENDPHGTKHIKNAFIRQTDVPGEKKKNKTSLLVMLITEMKTHCEILGSWVMSIKPMCWHKNLLSLRNNIRSDEGFHLFGSMYVMQKPESQIWAS